MGFSAGLGDMTANSGLDGSGRALGSVLDDGSIEAIARRVAELIGMHGPTGARELLTARQVADRFGVSRAWVYEHAEQLGVIRLGTGKRARLRFDARAVLERLRADTEKSDAQQASLTQWVDESDLIPIRGLKRVDRKERP
jgi:hypothetical protein